MTRRIDANTKLNIILDLGPPVVDYIVSLNPHDFVRLHNPLMRKFMAPRITLGRVAAMMGLPPSALLQRIAELADVEIDIAVEGGIYPQSQTEPPEWVQAVLGKVIPIVDLLPIDETLDADPMPPISRGIKQLADDGVLLIKHKWEPQPLYDIWSKVGIIWYAEQIGTDEWWIWVKRQRKASEE
jgi:hypothetical protein